MARSKSRGSDDYRQPNDFATGRGVTNWLNRILFPVLGPPPLGPYDQPAPTPASERACPLCGDRMDRHEKGVSDGRTLLYCPTDASAEVAATDG